MRMTTARSRDRKSLNAATAHDEHALQRTAASVYAGAGIAGLGRENCGGDADQHEHRHRQVAERPRGLQAEAEPLETLDDVKRTRARHHHADAVGRDVGRHAGGLLGGLEALDPERVDHDVLRRRRRGDQQRAERDQPWRRRGIAECEEHDGGHQQDLRQHQPAAPPAEPPGKQRHVERVDDRRPQEFQRVRRANQREQADGREIDAGLAHPHHQCRARQGERQSGRETEEQDDQDARLEIDGKRVAPGRRGGRGTLGRGHRVILSRHARPCAGHPRLWSSKQDVDGRDGHDIDRVGGITHPPEA